MNDKLFIVIPVHNRLSLTRECLLSLHRQTRSGFKIVVVDDGSTDGTSEMIKLEFPDVSVLRGDGNLWWTRATNIAVQHALDCGAEYVMTLNDDVIATEDFVEKMMFWAGREPKALLGAIALEHAVRVPIYGGEIINWKLASRTRLVDILRADEQHGLHRVTHLPGRGLLIPAEVFRKIGLFDAEHFPQSFADQDFTHRATRAGYGSFCNYDARLLVYPDSITSLASRKDKCLKNYFNHLFGIKGGANLVFFFFYGVRNCPKHILPLYLTIGFTRRIFGYPRDWLLETFHIRHAIRKKL
jgi:GT2 family glycosyltransferase